MNKFSDEKIMEILSNMNRGSGYYDFKKAEVCFNFDGEFKVLVNNKVSFKTTSLKSCLGFLRVYAN